MSHSEFEATPWLAQAWAATLAAGPAAALTGHAALYVHGVIDIPPAEIQVLGGKYLRSPHSWITFHRGDVGKIRTGLTHPLPAVSVQQGLIASCAAASEAEVVGLLTTACQRRVVPVESIQAALENTARVRNRNLIGRVLRDALGGCESQLERRYLNDVIRRHSLPRGRLQGRTAIGTRADQMFREFGLLVELDGRLGHVGVGAFRDAERDNWGTLSGWRTLRFGWYDVVSDACLVARMVSQGLADGGWTGFMQPCAMCPPPGVVI